MPESVTVSLVFLAEEADDLGIPRPTGLTAVYRLGETFAGG